MWNNTLPNQLPGDIFLVAPWLQGDQIERLFPHITGPSFLNSSFAFLVAGNASGPFTQQAF